MMKASNIDAAIGVAKQRRKMARQTLIIVCQVSLFMDVDCIYVYEDPRKVKERVMMTLSHSAYVYAEKIVSGKVCAEIIVY